jgi:hypothetical protein
MAEKTKVGKEKITREKGFLYCVGKDGFVWANPMKSNKTGKAKKVGTEKIVREKGFMYFIDKDGYVAKTPLQKRTKKPAAKKEPAKKK